MRSVNDNRPHLEAVRSTASRRMAAITYRKCRRQNHHEPAWRSFRGGMTASTSRYRRQGLPGGGGAGRGGSGGGWGGREGMPGGRREGEGWGRWGGGGGHGGGGGGSRWRPRTAGLRPVDFRERPAAARWWRGYPSRSFRSCCRC